MRIWIGVSECMMCAHGHDVCEYMNVIVMTRSSNAVSNEREHHDIGKTKMGILRRTVELLHGAAVIGLHTINGRAHLLECRLRVNLKCNQK
jgi:hypothetical protein